MARLTAGMRAPAFTLVDQSGRVVRLKDFAGARLVLYFYPADDTPGCTTEARQFNDELRHFAQRGTTVLGVSPDGVDRHGAFRTKYGLTFDLLSDPEKKVMAKYGAYGEKMMYGKRVLGVIRSTFVIGPTAKIERAWYAVRSDGHAARVLDSLAS